jgi:glycyl-tRNA synthetase beta chain
MTAAALAALPIPKLMRWGASRTQFVRPVHTLCLLFGGELVAGEVLGCNRPASSAATVSWAKPSSKSKHADQYPGILEERGMVIADFERRKAFIRPVPKRRRRLWAAWPTSKSPCSKRSPRGGVAVILTASFEEKFLAVPAEALVYTMKGDQKYFPVYDPSAADAKLHLRQQHRLQGPEPDHRRNERVVRPRLSMPNSSSRPQEAAVGGPCLESLATVLFQQQLGL